MHEIIYLRTNYEPWWMFEGWEEKVVNRHQFNSTENAQQKLESLKNDFDRRFSNQQQKDFAFTCYWNAEEVEYCEDCEEDLQIFHGLIWLVNGKPHTNF
ncbi:hypothetical protein Plano_1605 [Planococcus sp. PAMC 21323]|uniref:DUF1033 family protein n=1 Tax=Planococcus sp. PAMC 21323 TaxID=1526927 RepID=UPI000571743A|nr:DUF1033 family protein [Planococcus sp. PAMC 21323]AIY05570.1 hypothetical protein Plano_1605 [Planococcus sp. PAMC 21323]